MKWKVIEVEDLVTKTGKPMKKCTLLGDGHERTEPRVAIWENFPEFDKVLKDATINGDLKKEDSGTPIPAHPEKNYVNRTLVAEGSINSTTGNIEARVAKLEESVFGNNVPF